TSSTCSSTSSVGLVLADRHQVRLEVRLGLVAAFGYQPNQHVPLRGLITGLSAATVLQRATRTAGGTRRLATTAGTYLEPEMLKSTTSLVRDFVDRYPCVGCRHSVVFRV